jgi:hypothetical protein
MAFCGHCIASAISPTGMPHGSCETCLLAERCRRQVDVGCAGCTARCGSIIGTGLRPGRWGRMAAALPLLGVVVVKAWLTA